MTAAAGRQCVQARTRAEDSKRPRELDIGPNHLVEDVTKRRPCWVPFAAEKYVGEEDLVVVLEGIGSLSISELGCGH